MLQLVLSTFAERIDGPANIRTAPKGTPILTLNDNVEVGCSQPVNGWYAIVISLKITKEQYESNSPLMVGDSLFNWQNEFIGKSLATIPDSLQSTWYSGGAPRNPRRYGMDIYASTYKSNIKSESIPERKLNSIITSLNQQVSKSDLTNFITEFNFRTSGLLGKLNSRYEEQMIYESAINDPSPMDRIRLIFDDSKLIAIVHTRPLSDLLNSRTLTRGRNIIVLKKMNQAELQQFVQLNIKAYAGVD